MLAWHLGAQPLIGYNYGAKDQCRFQETIRFDLLVVAGFAFIATIALIIFAPVLIRLFMNDRVVIREGTSMIRWLSSSATLAGVILVFTTMFQSMGKASPAFWLSFCRQGLIFAVVIIVLHALFGYTGILAAQPAADLLTFTLALWLNKRYQPHFDQK